MDSSNFVRETALQLRLKSQLIKLDLTLEGSQREEVHHRVQNLQARCALNQRFEVVLEKFSLNLNKIAQHIKIFNSRTLTYLREGIVAAVQ